MTGGAGFWLADGPMAIRGLTQVLSALFPVAERKLDQAIRAWDSLQRTQPQ